MKLDTQTFFSQEQKITDVFALPESIVVYPGDCLDLLKTIPDESLQLVVTSPPYNIGKEYEKKLHLDLYLQQQAQVITECARLSSWASGRWSGDCSQVRRACATENPARNGRHTANPSHGQARV